MKSTSTPSLLVYIGIALLLFIVQLLVQTFLFASVDFYFPLWGIYLFLLCFLIVIYFAVVKVKTLLPDQVGLTFLALSGFKMLASIVFFIPLFQSDFENPVPAVFSFFIPYFIFLLMEVFLVVKILK